MQPQVLAPQPPRSPDGGAVAKAVGVLLLIPAVVLTVITLVIPTVRTVITSTRSENLIRGNESEPAGFDNYDKVLGDPLFWPSLWFAVSLVLLPILVAVVVAPLVAAALEWAGGWARWTGRIVLSLTLVVFAPVALAIAWSRTFREEPGLLSDIEQTGNTLRTSMAMMTFGVVCAVGVMVFLPAFRARQRLWPTVFTVAGVVVLGMLAIGVQQFTVPYLVTGFGPANKTMTPVGLLFTSAFQHADTGEGAAVSTVLLLILALLGVAAVLVVVLTRLRVSLKPLRQPAPAVRRAVNPGAIVVAILVLIAVGVAAVLTMGPWLDALGGPAPDSESGTEGRTWSWAVLGALVSVGVAYLAALGISGLRPLGRHSEWLLMLFAPWLFVGVAPLGIEFYKSLADQGEVNTDGALLPPILVAIVPLLIMAVLCRGQSERWQQQVTAGAPAGSTFFRTVVLPTLPLAALLMVVAIFVNAQDLFWPLLSVFDPENATTSLMLVRVQNSFATGDFSVASATPLLAVVLGFLALALVQVLHLDRMTATVGKPAGVDEPTPPFGMPAMPPQTPVR